MQLRDKGNLQTYHVLREVGEKIVAAGLADEVKEVQPKKPQPNLTFYVQRGARPEGPGGAEYPPLLRWSCRGCGIGQGCYTESWKGTAHETTVVRHCGLVEKCPPDVAKEYLAAFNKWRSNRDRASLSSGPISRHSGGCSGEVDPQDHSKLKCGCTRKVA